jgi:hypothetical protein
MTMTNSKTIIANTVRVTILAVGTVFVLAPAAMAQCAGCGADYNRAERARIQEHQRLERVDPPVRPDPIGNALIGAGVTTVLRGTTAGAVSAVRGGALGTAIQEGRESIRQNRVENQQTGRGGSSDPRYDPRSLFR